MPPPRAPIAANQQAANMAPNLSTASIASLISMAPDSCTPYSASPVVILSKRTVYPDRKSTLGEIPLSVSDLPMLSCHYIQKGLFFPSPPIPLPALLSLLASSLSRALSLFPALAGRLRTLPDGRILVSCNDSGAELAHAAASSLSIPALLPPFADVPHAVKSLFPLDGAISFHGHFRPLAAFQLTELADGAIFLGAAVNHAVVDGTSFWHFFNSWAELCRGGAPALPDFRRNYFGDSSAILSFPGGRGPEVTFSASSPIRERVFRFSREAIAELKQMVNASREEEDGGEVSSFQSLCALVWRTVTRARKLPMETATTFRMAVNCRHRVAPPVAARYFGNSIQSVPTTAAAGEVAGRGIGWTAGLLHRSVAAHGDEAVRSVVAAWEAAPRCFPLGNPDGAGVTMGSSHRFPMYEGNDFGWGQPAAVRSGRANKFDGKMSAFPGREGGGSVELEVCLAPETMASLLRDEEFMSYVSE